MTNIIDNMPNRTSVQVEGLASTYEAGTHIEPHSHDAHQIVHAISGTMRVRAHDAAWVLPPGRGLWVPAQTVHEIWCKNPLEMRTVYINGDHPAIRSNLLVVSVSNLLREILVRFAESIEEWQKPHLTALLLGEVAVMKVEPLRLPTPQDEQVAEICAKLYDDPADNRTLPEWAATLGLSPRTFMRRIQSETGMSFRELRRQARILASIERLAQGQPVTTVALDVGFESPSAFTYAFRSVTGSTPRDYLA